MTERCQRCHRLLKDQKSKELGYGPVCWAEVSYPAPDLQGRSQLTLEFEPTSGIFTAEMSMAEQYRIVKRILSKRDV